jgi:hypothetical protein
VLTARYALSSYIKQICLVLKGLKNTVYNNSTSRLERNIQDALSSVSPGELRRTCYHAYKHSTYTDVAAVFRIVSSEG